MMEHFVHQENYSIKYGNDPDGTFTMSAYLMVAWFQAFYDVTGDERWLKVIDFSYRAMEKYYHLNPSTGLMPYTFNIFTLEVRDPEKDLYSWDACRVPWRFGTDYIWNGCLHSTLAHDCILTNVKWFYRSTGGDPANHGCAYTLDGKKLNDYAETAIIAPMAVGAMVDASQQEWLNTLYDHLTHLPFAQSGDSYFNDQLLMLALIVVTGNHPNMLVL